MRAGRVGRRSGEAHGDLGGRGRALVERTLLLLLLLWQTLLLRGRRRRRGRQGGVEGVELLQEGLHGGSPIAIVTPSSVKPAPASRH